MNPDCRRRYTPPADELGPEDQGTPLTLEEFFRRSSREGSRYELIRGQLSTFPFPSMPHEILRDIFRDKLHAYAEEQPEVFNEVYGPGRFILREADHEPSAPAPDIICFADFAIRESLATASWEDGTPYLAVEILAPETVEKDLDRNPDLYLQVRTLREYWIIDPRQSYEHPEMIVYRQRGQHWQKPIHVESGGTYTSRFLPGLALVLVVGRWH